jgi:long-chain acyl-CoA synthetase
MYQLSKPDNIVEILEKSVSKFSQRPFLGTKNKKLPMNHAELLKNEETKKFLKNEIVNSLKSTYGSYKIPKKFIFIDEPFSLENGMLTQTMKLKRRFVFEKYKDQIDVLYAK